MVLKSRILVLLMVLGIFAAPENIVKTSTVPFSFLGTGVVWGISSKASGMNFTCKRSFAGSGVISISWSIPSAVKAGAAKISVFTVSGKMVKSFGVASQSGTVEFKPGLGKMSEGVYISTLTYGTFKKSLKMVF